MNKSGLSASLNYIFSFLITLIIFALILTNLGQYLFSISFWKSAAVSSGVIEVRTIEFKENLESLGDASGIPYSAFKDINFKPFIAAGISEWIDNSFKYYSGKDNKIESPDTSEINESLRSAVINYAKTSNMTVDSNSVDNFIDLCSKSFIKLCEPISGIEFISAYIRKFFHILHFLPFLLVLFAIFVITLCFINYRKIPIAINWLCYSISASGLLAIATGLFAVYLKHIKESLFSHAFINYFLNSASIRLFIVGLTLIVFSQLVLVILRSLINRTI